MKDNEWQVVNRELSKALKKAGFKQEGIFWWVFQGNEWKLRSAEWLHNWIGGQELDICIADLIERGTAVVAPTVAELGGVLPAYYPLNNFDYNYVSIKKVSTAFKEFWVSMYFCGTQCIGQEFKADTEANARAKMWLYLKKEGLL
ncbi:hypothetical protein LCGC14_1275080 [marine sediment metagenome]|uniref:Uncharacterized protein n=1 Tax=marine sediment metagenome TaxID=412755 RepID=A0A0F9P042_9ZZZZ